MEWRSLGKKRTREPVFVVMREISSGTDSRTPPLASALSCVPRDAKVSLAYLGKGLCLLALQGELLSNTSPAHSEVGWSWGGWGEVEGVEEVVEIVMRVKK